MKQEIILGSANFNQKYGIKKNYIPIKEIKKLLDYAFKNKIKKIDTSPLYNKSEKIIGLLNNNRFKIISKIPKIPKNIVKKNIKSWIKTKATNSIKELKIKKFECLLLHHANSLLGKNGDEVYKSMKNIKLGGLTNKIGISIYDFKMLDKILNRFKFDIVQAPFNIFDRRLIESGLLNKLKKRKIEIHVRSIFLQGILLLKFNQLPKKLKKVNKKWMLWEYWLKQNKLDSLQACLSFILNQKKLNAIVVGYNSKKQLSKFLKFKKEKNNFFIPNFKIKNKNLTDPRKWLN